MKKSLSILPLILMLTLSGCSLSHSQFEINPISSNPFSDTSIDDNSDSKETMSEVDRQIYAVYLKAVNDHIYTGTYSEWLDYIKGEKGDQGEKGDTGETGATGAQGEKGDTGATGLNGNDGTDGTNGNDGFSLLSGAGIPSETVGKNGDAYIDTETWDFYTKENDSWSLTGNIKGDTGKTIKGDPGQTGETGGAGKDGEDGITPQVRINSETNEWEVSMDNGTSWISTSVNATGTDGNDGVGIKDITVDESGNLILSLTDGTTKNIAVMSHKHNYETEIVNATCTADGYIKVTCKECGDVQITKTPAKGHVWNAWIETSPTTEEQDGIKTRICDICGESETQTISKHKHIYSDGYFYDQSSHWQKCTICGIRHNEENHCTTDGFCSVCDYHFSESKGFSDGLMYGLKDDDTYCLYGLGSCSDTEITIPSTYNGKPVTEITDLFMGNKDITQVILPDSISYIPGYAFQNCTSLESIKLPQSLASINISSFSGCNNLTSVVMPEHLQGIGQSAFEYCSKLTSINIPDTVAGLGVYSFMYCSSLESVSISENMQGISNQAFYMCKSLKNIVCSDNIQGIGKEAFSGCSSLESVTFGSNLKEIGVSAFAGCNLKGIVLPNSVTTIGLGAFNNCINLTSAIFSNTEHWAANNVKLYPEALSNSAIAARYLRSTYSNTQWTCSILTYTLNEEQDGYIVTMAHSSLSDETSIVIPSKYHDLPVKEIGRLGFDNCSQLKDIVIPDSITTIDEIAFEYCVNITSVTIPNSVTEIGEHAFYECSSLADIEIPNSVTSIGSMAFYGCPLTCVTIPKSVIYLGSDVFVNYGSLIVYCEATSKPDGWSTEWLSNSGYAIVNNTFTERTRVFWGNDGKVKTYTFVTNGGTEIKDISAHYLETSPDTTRDGYYFVAWYSDESLTTQVTFPYGGVDGTTLYAKWNPLN